MNKKEIINYLKSYTEPPQMMKVFPDCRIIKEAITMLEQQDSLPKNLETAAMRYAIPAYMKGVDEKYLHEYPRDPIKEKAFIDGAEWQKEQDKDWLNDQLTKVHLDGVITGAEMAAKSSPMPEDTVIFQKGIEEGKRLMMEDAEDGEIGYWNQSGLSIRLDQSLEKLGYDMDTKVKIIIVKQ